MNPNTIAMAGVAVALENEQRNAARIRDLERQLEQQADKEAKLQQLCAHLLEDLQRRTIDRADSSLPEWEAMAARLGVTVPTGTAASAGGPHAA